MAVCCSSSAGKAVEKRGHSGEDGIIIHSEEVTNAGTQMMSSGFSSLLFPKETSLSSTLAPSPGKLSPL